MSIFNEEQVKAMMSGRYICSECGSVMEFEDEWEYWWHGGWSCICKRILIGYNAENRLRC